MKKLDIFRNCEEHVRLEGSPQNINRVINVMMERYPVFYEKYKAIIDLREDDTGIKNGRAIDKELALAFYLRRTEFLTGKKFRCQGCGSYEYKLKKKIPLYELPKFCSDSCTKSSEEVRTKCVNTVREIYGTDNPSQSAQVKKKLSENNTWVTLKRDDPDAYRSKMISREILKRERYGENYELLNGKRILTNTAKLGVPWPTMCKKVLDLRASNHTKKYGVPNPSQRPEIQEKITRNKRTSNHKKVAVNGKVFSTLQGYEPKALRYLVSCGVPVESISKPKISIPYTDSTGKERFYHPDFLITKRKGKKNVMVEVKSSWTAGLLADDRYYHRYSTLKEKSIAVQRKGYDFLLLIMEDTSAVPLYEKLGVLPKKLTLVRL